MKISSLSSAFICSLLTALAFSSPSSAQYLVHCTNCSDTFTQSLERVTNLEKLQQVYKQVTEAIKQTEQQVELVQKNIDQLENMVKNTASLPDKIRTKILGTFQKLSSLSQSLNLQRGDASALSQIFSSTYAGTGTIRDLAKSTRETMESAAGTFDEMRKKWSDEVDRSQQAAFQESGMQIPVQSDSLGAATSANPKANPKATTALEKQSGYAAYLKKAQRAQV